MSMWKRFWFKPSSGRPEALFRIAYGVVLFLDLAGQAGGAGLFFSNAGIHPVTPWDFLYPAWAVSILHALWMGVLVLLVLGFWTRACAVLNFLFLIYFVALRGYAALHGVDWVYHSMGFYLVFMDSGRRYCVPLARKGRNASAAPSPIWPVRLAQLNIASIYFLAGFAKIVDPGWMDGSAFGQYVRHPFFGFIEIPEFLLHDGVLTGINYGSIAWELVFPLLLVFRFLRPWAVLSVIAFHIGIALTLRVGWFNEAMIGCMFLFADDVFRRSKEDRPLFLAHPKRRPVYALVNMFLMFHMLTFCWAQYVHMTRSVQGLPPTAFRVIQNPVLSHYAFLLARMEYYNLVPSSSLIGPVRFLYFDAVDDSGQTVPMYPFDEDQAFRPGPGAIRVTRPGILAKNIASDGLSLRQWKAYLGHLLTAYNREYAGRSPSAIRVFRISAELDEFPRPRKSLQVPKELLVRAEFTPWEGGLDMNLVFTREGKRWIQDETTF